MKGDYIREALREGASLRQTAKRQCTDCGKPTTQYRCEKCWRKLRGFGFEASGDGSEAEARQRRKKPVPLKPDDFVPLAPRPALPDRQAEFFANQEKRVKQQTYTVPELAALFGLPQKDVANAKDNKRRTPRPGSKVAIVRERMLAKGITWDQVINAPRGRKAAKSRVGEAA